MKKNLTFFIIFSLSLAVNHAQLAEDSWSFGFGGIYPRFMNHNVQLGSAFNYGGFFNFQRNFNEHVGLRMQPFYTHIQYDNANPLDSYTDIIGLDFDFIYYILPCESITPYVLMGAGPLMYILESPESALTEDYYFTGKLNFAIGMEWKLSRNWNMNMELAYLTVFTDQIDGKFGSGTGGLFTDDLDSYMTASLGFKYFFSKGKLSRLCILPGGMTDVFIPEEEKVDYQKIEEMIKENIPRVITREVVVEKPVEQTESDESGKHWILTGVNFGSGSRFLTNESFPILREAIEILKANPSMIVEIQGHTDSTGPADFNMRLSEQRAQSVKEFMKANGIESSRLQVRGYGESQPISDNYTAEGRARNRRIEFKILSK